MMDDLISRQAVLDYVLKDNYCNGGWFEIEEDKYVEWLKALPSVQPTTCIAKISFDDQQMKEMVDKAISNLDFSDLISRRAAIDVVEREEFKGDAISEIEKLPSVQPEQKWIPVSERLPLLRGFSKLSDDVLITNGFEIYIGHVVEKKGEIFWHYYCSDIEVGNVTAWMPLPETYKAGSEG